MHELSIAQNIIEIVQDHVPENKQKSVKIIRVKIGKLTNILTDSLQFGFEALTRETSLSSASLEIEELPLTIECRECGQKRSINDFIFSCPGCQSSDIQVVSGNELSVSEIELND
jgi:hydrogenase nickel incorporation protein HypA/HybF